MRCAEPLEGFVAGVVKLRKGESAKMMSDMKDMTSLYKCFLKFAEKLEIRCVCEPRKHHLLCKALA